MLRISKLTDYGIILATFMASDDQLKSVREISELTSIPYPTTGKLLKLLCKAQIVRSERGPKGGYKLTAEAKQITIRRVIEAIEGTIAITECADDEHLATCDFEQTCELKGNWQKINQSLQNALDKISLADMAPAPKPHAEQLVDLARSAPEKKVNFEPKTDSP